MKQPEAKLKQQLRADFKLVYGAEGVSYYFPPTLATGVPDLIFIAEGRTVFVEAKYESNELTKLQKIQRDRITAAGGRWRLVHGFDGGAIHIRDELGQLRQGFADPGAKPGKPFCSLTRTVWFWRSLLGL